MEEFIEVEHPGKILKEEFMEPCGVSPYKLAKETGIDKMTLSFILKGTRAITPVTALKLSKFFGLSSNYWVYLQADYDVRMAEIKIGEDLGKIKTLEPISELGSL